VLTREASFRDTCSLVLGQCRFIETLRRESVDPFALDAFVERAARIMGLSVPSRPQACDSIDDLLLALAPTLRLDMLKLSNDYPLETGCSAARAK